MKLDKLGRVRFSREEWELACKLFALVREDMDAMVRAMDKLDRVPFTAAMLQSGSPRVRDAAQTMDFVSTEAGAGHVPWRDNASDISRIQMLLGHLGSVYQHLTVNAHVGLVRHRPGRPTGIATKQHDSTPRVGRPRKYQISDDELVTRVQSAKTAGKPRTVALREIATSLERERLKRRPSDSEVDRCIATLKRRMSGVGRK